MDRISNLSLLKTRKNTYTSTKLRCTKKKKKQGIIIMSPMRIIKERWIQPGIEATSTQGSFLTFGKAFAQ